MTKVALIEAKPSRTNFMDHLSSFEFDRYSLCSDANKKKVLKSDIDIDIQIDEYDWVILIGSEAFKHYTGQSGITTFSGKVVDEKFLPLINPAMLQFKPEVKPLWDESKLNIEKYISGEAERISIDYNNVRGIQNEKEALEYVQAAIDSPSNYVGLDSETTGLFPRDGYVLGISLSYEKDVGVYIDSNCVTEILEEKFQELFNKKTMILHNAKFDIAFFERHFGWKIPNFEDTMLLHYCIDENPGTHGLKDLAVRYTKYGNYEQEQADWIATYCRQNKILKGNFTYDLIPFDIIYKYAAIDAIVTLLLFLKFKLVINKNSKLNNVYTNILLRGTTFLVKMQDNGVPFDRERLEWGQQLLHSEIEELNTNLRKHPEIAEFEAVQGKEFNPNSVLQLRNLLFDYIGLMPTGKKTGKGLHSTDKEVLTILSSQHEVPSLILGIRTKNKMKNTYIDKILPQLDTDNRLRTNFNLHGTVAGRLSSSGKLNMQQLPRDHPVVKGCIKAREGYSIVSMDLSTAEVYVAAVLSNDKVLQNVFKSGGDFHSAVAKKVFNLPCEISEVKDLYPVERQAAKAISFGIMYGAGPNKIWSEVAKENASFTMADAKDAIADYFGEFKGLKKWIDGNKKIIADQGFVYSFFGRKRRLPNVGSTNQGIVGHEIRSGLNFMVQSPASDVNLLGAMDAMDELEQTDLDASMFALVHDSILAEVKNEHIEEYKKIVKHNIQRDRGISIPGCPIGCDFEIGKDYSGPTKLDKNITKFEEKYGTDIKV